MCAASDAQQNPGLVAFLLAHGASLFAINGAASAFDLLSAGCVEAETAEIVWQFVGRGGVGAVPPPAAPYPRRFRLQPQDVFAIVQHKRSAAFDALLWSTPDVVEMRFPKHNSLLHILCRYGTLEMVVAFIRVVEAQHAAYAVTLNGEGETPLMNALTYNRGQHALVLLAARIENQLQAVHPRTGRSVLHYLSASKIGSATKKVLFCALLMRASGVNAQDSDGNTCVHLLLKRRDDAGVVALLYNHGADIFVANAKSETAFTIAQAGKDAAALAFLFDHEFETADGADGGRGVPAQDLGVMLLGVMSFLDGVDPFTPVHDWEVVLKMKRTLDGSALFAASELEPQGSGGLSFVEFMAIKYECETVRNQLGAVFDQNAFGREVRVTELIQKGYGRGIQNSELLVVSLSMLHETIGRCLALGRYVPGDGAFPVALATASALYGVVEEAKANYYAT